MIIFDSLTEDDTLKIVGKLLKEVQDRVSELGVTVEVSEAAMKWLAKEGFDRMYGARPLRRAHTAEHRKRAFEEDSWRQSGARQHGKD